MIMQSASRWSRRAETSDGAAVRTAGVRYPGQVELRVGLVPGAVEHLGEHLGRLGTGDAVLAVDDVERDTVGAEGAGLVDVGEHRVGVLRAGEHLVDTARVEPD